MIVTYGRPLDYSGDYEKYATNFWKNCVEYCFLLRSCVAAYSPATPINCQIFSANQLRSVKRLSSNDGQLVAFKIQTSFATCPTAQNQMLAPAYGTSSDQRRNYTYTITQDDPNNMWYLTYKNVSKCDPGWSLFERSKGDWCIRVFGGPSSTFTQPEAENQCILKNSMLSGLETQEERKYVTDSASSLLGSNYPNFSAFWLSGIRKAECEEDGWQSISYCHNNIEQFNFTDAYLTTFFGYTWDLNQPDQNAAGYWQNCIQIWIREQYQSPGWNFNQHPNGAIDDAPCFEGINQYYAMRGFVCGKPAE